jgi:uncharacterized paraquat-inducible protein A
LAFGTNPSLADHRSCCCSRCSTNAVAAAIREWWDVLKLDCVSLGISLLLLLLSAHVTGFIAANASGSGVTRHI